MNLLLITLITIQSNNSKQHDFKKANRKKSYNKKQTQISNLLLSNFYFNNNHNNSKLFLIEKISSLFLLKMSCYVFKKNLYLKFVCITLIVNIINISHATYQKKKSLFQIRFHHTNCKSYQYIITSNINIQYILKSLVPKVNIIKIIIIIIPYFPVQAPPPQNGQFWKEKKMPLMPPSQSPRGSEKGGPLNEQRRYKIT
eukprot:TRINITY_DN7934_c2_g2_i4.p2 TRINITY_DN7934_c2_g2~~TRINITY_DN7934_c2_g2_i4.p2  ORF type:complete len:199 (+),score=-18.02 TRINITY_DN7934_c2_g2_i4:1413-2009(+)